MLFRSTLNAVVFGSIIRDFNWQSAWATDSAIVIVLALEAGLLFVAANTGFLGGPAVLANMAADSWVPHQFRYLSTRLVTENGIVLMGAAALAILLWTGGDVTILVVIYSVSVFLTFAVSLFGLCVYWWRSRRAAANWLLRLALSGAGFAVCTLILAMLIARRLADGGWLALALIAGITALCLAIRSHYDATRARLLQLDEAFSEQPFGSEASPPPPDPALPTAAFLVGSSRGGGLHALLWVQRLFPGNFKNFIFINVRAVDAHVYGGREDFEALQTQAHASLNYFVNFCNSYGLAAKGYVGFGTDAIEEFMRLAEQVQKDFPNTIFFTSKLIFRRDNWLIRLLHNQAALAIQRRLHLEGKQMVILPLQLEKTGPGGEA